MQIKPRRDRSNQQPLEKGAPRCIGSGAFAVIENAQPTFIEPKAQRCDADDVFYELTGSICPECRKVIDAKILLRNNNVYMAKRCPECGPCEALIYSDAQMYLEVRKIRQTGDDSTRIRHRDQRRMSARLRPLPRPPAARELGHH
jgi:hypothetical protein